MHAINSERIGFKLQLKSRLFDIYGQLGGMAIYDANYVQKSHFYIKIMDQNLK